MAGSSSGRTAAFEAVNRGPNPCPAEKYESQNFWFLSFEFNLMQVGIVGLPNVGKSTLFKALTKKQVDTANYPFCTIDPNVGVVAVPDERLEKLSAISHSEKTCGFLSA